MNPSKWDRWLVDMPFEEGIGSKLRPALVVDYKNGDVIAGKMTKHPPRPNYPYKYLLLNWKGAGLNIPTTLRLSKLSRLPVSKFIKK